MMNQEWPILPTFLSLRQGCSEETAKYNWDGIYYPDYIRGFLADLSHDKNIQNALSIFQFVPEGFRPLDSNANLTNDEISTNPKEATVLWNENVDDRIKTFLGNRRIIRIDSGTFINNGRLCAAFRDCGYKECCFKQDSLVAIFAKEELDNYDPDSIEYQEALLAIIKDLNAGKEEKHQIKCDVYEANKGKKRFYIHYTCPFSLFEEHIFPIYMQGRIIACLMFGQMAIKMFDHQNAFYDYKEEMMPHINFEEAIKQVKVYNQNDWMEKINTIVNRIETFEDRLNERIIHRNTRFINERFDKIEAHFREDVRKISIKRQNVISRFTIALNKAFTAIRKEFDSSNEGFIRMFALPFDTEHRVLIPIGWSGGDFDKVDKERYAFSLMPFKRDEVHHSVLTDVILEAASPSIKAEYDMQDLFYYGKQVNDEIAYIVWKRHGSEIRRKEDGDISKAYRNALKKFYSVALECYSYIRGARMELLLETTIRESVHESAHFILPAIDVVREHLNMVPESMIYKDYLETFRKDILKPFESYKEEVLESFFQLKEINNGSSLIFSSELPIKKKPVQVFPLLYKMKKMLDNRASDSNKSILYEQKESYVEVRIDVAHFNHALFNLLDNAIKYGFDGSYIYIKMNVDKKRDLLNIQFISYGIGIKDEDDIYALWERSENAARMAAGTGIGMYLVRKICEAHGGSITHKSELLSNYNIPVLFNYKYKKSLAKGFSIEETQKFDDEIATASKVIESEVVNDHSFVKYGKVFASRIYTPTYRNSFFVTIPLD